MNLTGHGHVYPRADGYKARCGGPTFCEACLNDLAALEGANVHAQTALKTQYADPNHVLTDLLDGMRTQLLIVLVNRAGGRAEVPVSEIDANGAWLMSMAVSADQSAFIFETRKKD